MSVMWLMDLHSSTHQITAAHTIILNSCRVIAGDTVEANKYLYVATEKQMARSVTSPVWSTCDVCNH